MSDIILNEDQLKMFNEINNNNTIDKYVLRGYAGTGKTVTLSKIITDGVFNNILVIAPTVKALSVLMSKMPSNLRNKKITFATMSKTIEKPSEQIEVLEQTFTLNEDQMMGPHGLKALLERLRIWDDDIITTRTIYKKSKNEIKYIINEHLLETKLKERFNGKAMMKPTYPSFEYKDIFDIAEELKEYDLIIIDEMSMISEEHINVVEEALEKVKKLMSKTKQPVKLIMSGDKGQLPPVNGRLNHFFEMENPDDAFVVDLTKILRSTDNIAKVAQLIRQGMDIKHIASTVDNGLITNLTATEFCDQNEELLKTIDIALAFTNKDVDIFNAKIREARGFSGTGANVGEPLIVLENSVPNSNGIVNFANGEEFTVVKKYSSEEEFKVLKETFDTLKLDDNFKDLKEELSVYVENGIVEMIDLIDVMGNIKTGFIPFNLTTQYGYVWKNMKEAFKNLASLNDGELPLLHVTYSYARTIHKSQGSEWNNVLLWITSKNLWAMGQENVVNKRKLPYTGYTRARSVCHLVYSN